MKKSPSTPQACRYISLAEVAHMYDVSVYTVRRRISDGTVPAKRVGRQLRIREDHASRMADDVGTMVAR